MLLLCSQRKGQWQRGVFVFRTKYSIRAGLRFLNKNWVFKTFATKSPWTTTKLTSCNTLWLFCNISEKKAFQINSAMLSAECDLEELTKNSVEIFGWQFCFLISASLSCICLSAIVISSLVVGQICHFKPFWNLQLYNLSVKVLDLFVSSV